MLQERGELILKHYNKYRTNRALGFCSSKKHAEYMAGYFRNNGVNAVAVYSGPNGENAVNRETALSGLKRGKIQVIFSVDMFNEGVEVPKVNTRKFPFYAGLTG